MSQYRGGSTPEFGSRGVQGQRKSCCQKSARASKPSRVMTKNAPKHLGFPRPIRSKQVLMNMGGTPISSRVHGHRRRLKQKQQFRAISVQERQASEEVSESMPNVGRKLAI